MGKVTQINNGDTGLQARTAYNEAMKEVEIGAEFSGDGTVATPLTFIGRIYNVGRTFYGLLSGAFTTNRTITVPDKDFTIAGTDDISSLTYQIEVALSQLDTDLEAATGVAKFPCPEDITIQSVFVQVDTAPTGSTAQWDINVEGSTILSTKITIDAGEFSSLTAATPPVISSADVDKGDDFVIDRDQVGATIAGQNDILVITYTKR